MKKGQRKKIILVLGGARSGKSSYAVSLAESRFKRPLYLATAEAFDREMVKRIKLHREARGPAWGCLEEPLEVASAIGKLPSGTNVVLIDCITIWLSNLMLKEGVGAYERRKVALLAALQKSNCEIIIVSNEVGMGIVPDNKLGREFRDYAGWLNQDLAKIADEVVFVVAGIPLVIKGKKGKR